MQLKTIILLGSLLLAQTIAVPVSASSSVMSSMEIQRRGHNAHIKVNKEHINKSPDFPVATGYVEEDVLYLSFSQPLSNVHIRVADREIGNTVFEGIVSGTFCSISLERDSESFEIYY